MHIPTPAGSSLPSPGCGGSEECVAWGFQDSSKNQGKVGILKFWGFFPSFSNEFGDKNPTKHSRGSLEFWVFSGKSSPSESLDLAVVARNSAEGVPGFQQLQNPLRIPRKWCGMGQGCWHPWLDFWNFKGVTWQL